MTEKINSMNYSMKYGGIEEVLSGEGRSVDNLEELYPSAESQGMIIIPKLIGVHQTIREEAKLIESRAYDFVQRFVDQRYKSEDGVDGSLISLVYDNRVMAEGVLRTIISGKDVMRRVKLVDFRSAPNFNLKPIISDNRVTKLLDDLRSKKTRKTALNLLEREMEYFSLNLEHFGLTRIEAINHDTLKEMIETMKEAYSQAKSDDLNKQNGPDIITDPLAIKLTELISAACKKAF